MTDTWIIKPTETRSARHQCEWCGNLIVQRENHIYAYIYRSGLQNLPLRFHFDCYRAWRQPPGHKNGVVCHDVYCECWTPRKMPRGTYHISVPNQPNTPTSSKYPDSSRPPTSSDLAIVSVAKRMARAFDANGMMPKAPGLFPLVSDAIAEAKRSSEDPVVFGLRSFALLCNNAVPAAWRTAGLSADTPLDKQVDLVLQEIAEFNVTWFKKPFDDSGRNTILIAVHRIAERMLNGTPQV